MRGNRSVSLSPYLHQNFTIFLGKKNNQTHKFSRHRKSSTVWRACKQASKRASNQNWRCSVKCTIKYPNQKPTSNFLYVRIDVGVFSVSVCICVHSTSAADWVQKNEKEREWKSRCVYSLSILWGSRRNKLMACECSFLCLTANAQAIVCWHRAQLKSKMIRSIRKECAHPLYFDFDNYTHLHQQNIWILLFWNANKMFIRVNQQGRMEKKLIFMIIFQFFFHLVFRVLHDKTNGNRMCSVAKWTQFAILHVVFCCCSLQIIARISKLNGVFYIYLCLLVYLCIVIWLWLPVHIDIHSLDLVWVSV